MLTIEKLKQRLIDRLGEELLKEKIPSEEYVNYAQAILILTDIEIYNMESFPDTEQSADKFDLDKFWSGLVNLYKPNKKN